jgi:hypothetical protein
MDKRRLGRDQLDRSASSCDSRRPIIAFGCFAASKVETMNWRRGLFRLWIVGTVLFVLAIAFVSYSEIKAQFDVTDPTELYGSHQ